MEEFTKIASGIYLEGLAVDHARDVIWYSDVIAGGIHGVKPDGTKVCSFNEGRMWTGGIMWNNPDTGKSGWLLDELAGKPINGINEMMPDGGDTLKEGGEITATNSFLFKGRTETPGLKIEPARFDLG